MEEKGPSRSPQASPGQVVPLFPLADVWLFPSVLLPLHIFEERYRQMIEDCLDGPGRIALATIQKEAEPDTENPPVYPVAGLGEIGRHERLADGRFHVLLVGLRRVLVQEVPSDRLYRKAEVHPAPEIPIPAERDAPLRAELLAGLAQRTKDLPEIPDEFSTSYLVDMLLLRMPLAHEALNRLYCELDVEQRARGALREHERSSAP